MDSLVLKPKSRPIPTSPPQKKKEKLKMKISTGNMGDRGNQVLPGLCSSYWRRLSSREHAKMMQQKETHLALQESPGDVRSIC